MKCPDHQIEMQQKGLVGFVYAGAIYHHVCPRDDNRVYELHTHDGRQLVDTSDGYGPWRQAG